MVTPGPTDEDLVRQAQEGSREAFLALYERYLNKVFSRVKSRVPAQDAEDVTQEVFIALVRSLNNFEHRSRFSTWLYTIVNRSIADFYRKRQRSGAAPSVNLEDAESTLPASTLEDEHIGERMQIQRAFNNLKEHYREIILLRFVDGMSFAEIAAHRRESFEATKSLYRRAIEAMRDQIRTKV